MVQVTSPSAGAEQQLKARGIALPAPPRPFGTYAEAVQTGNLLFVSGMLPTDGGAPAIVGRLGAELDLGHVGSDPNVDRYDPDLWTDEFAFLSQPGQAEIERSEMTWPIRSAQIGDASSGWLP